MLEKKEITKKGKWVMNKNSLWVLVAVCATILAITMPADICAAALDSGELNSEVTKIKDFLFGVPVRAAGVLGGAYGLVMAVVTSSMRPLMVYGGIGLMANLVPKFIDLVF